MELKHNLHQLAKEGKLGGFLNRKEYVYQNDIEKRPYRLTQRSPLGEDCVDSSNNTQGISSMIVGRFSEEYLTIRAAKDSAHTLLKGAPKSAFRGPVMKFDATISKPFQQPHTGSLVVTIKIGQMKFRWTFVNN